MPELSLAALRGLLPQMRGANFGTTSPQEEADMPLSGLDRAVAVAGSGIARQVETPGALMRPNPYPQGSEAWQWYEDNKQKAALQWAPEMALNMAGPGLAVGAPVKAGEFVAGAGPIRAYHSSPHDFERFDLSKIGTGEGAQVYGHGLYFAENPAVSGQGGQYWNQFSGRFLGPERTAAIELQMSKFDRELAQRNMLEQINKMIDRGDSPGVIANRTKALQLLESGKPVGPRTYEVDINADPAHFLDWDNVLPKDSPARAKLLELGEKGMKHHAGGIDRQFAKDSILSAQNELLTGEGALRVMGKAVDQARPILKAEGDPYALFGSLGAMSSRMLNEAGIPGIKYLDQGSRLTTDTATRLIPDVQRRIAYANEIGASDVAKQKLADELANYQKQLNAASSNYVVFNPGIIDIRRKYGLAGLAPLAGVGAVAGQGEGQPQM